MHRLTDAAVMDVWEQGRARHPIDRALLLFAFAAPELAQETLADQPIGRRDAAILALRNATFGSRIDGYGQCPACGERFEFALDGRALRDIVPSAPRAEFDDAQGRTTRLPTSRDLAALAAAGIEGEPAALALAQACMPGVAEPETGAFERWVAEQDPAADLRLDLACEACAHGWALGFDPASWCWEEIEARSLRLLDEVHVLALAYGWSEDQVLRLSPARRRAYLDRCSA